MRTMVYDLQNHNTDDIEKAFTEWRRNETKIPTPADIIKIINGIQAQKSRAYDFKALPAKQKPSRIVSWAHKSWVDFTEQDKAGLLEHMKTFESKEDADRYKKYLKLRCGVPMEFLNKGE